MPIYEFLCKPCNDRFEVLTTISRAAETKCPKCGSGKITRLMSTFSAQFTGSNPSSSSSDSACSTCSSHNCRTCSH